MTFDEALLKALEGCLIRRVGWPDKDRVVYRVLVNEFSDYTYYTLEASQEDMLETDWVCCGWLH